MRFDLPTPDVETQPFWDGCKEGRFLLRHCNACGEYHFYPRPFCPKCWSDDVTWKDASGRGQVYTYSVVRQNDLPPFPERVPYVAAVVELDEGPRVMTNIEQADFDDARDRHAGRGRLPCDLRRRHDPRVPSRALSDSVGRRERAGLEFPVRGAVARGLPAAPRRAERVDGADRLAAGARPQDARAHPHGRDRRRCATPQG